MYEKIKADILDTYYQQNFSNDGQRFVAWYLRNIHRRDRSQTKYDITDGQDDKQIDAILIDENSQIIYIIQGKFSPNKIDGEPLREVTSSWLQLKDLVRLQETGNEKLKRRLLDVSNAIDDEYEIIGSSLNSVGKGITIYHNPRSNKSLCPSLRKNSSG